MHIIVDHGYWILLCWGEGFTGGYGALGNFDSLETLSMTSHLWRGPMYSNSESVCYHNRGLRPFLEAGSNESLEALKTPDFSCLTG